MGMIIDKTKTIATAMLALAFGLSAAFSATAGEVVWTGHELKVNLKVATQEFKGSEEEQYKIGKEKLTEKDIIEICEGYEKGRVMALQMMCGNEESNVISILDTDPVSNLGAIGYVGFLSDPIANTNNDGSQTKSALLSAVVVLFCEGFEAVLWGTLDVAFKDLEGQDCANTANFEGGGSEEEVGLPIPQATVKAKKRSLAIAGSLPPS